MSGETGRLGFVSPYRFHLPDPAHKFDSVLLGSAKPCKHMKSIQSARPPRCVRAFLLLFGMIVATTAARAQLVVFNFTGTSPGQNTPWTTTSTLASGITLTGWTLGSVTGSATNNRFTATGWSTGSTFSAASSGNDYITFSITPTSGNQLSLSGATVTYTLQNSATGPDFYSVRSSVDSFGSDLSASSAALDATGTLTTSTSLTLPSSVAYTGLTGAVEFRIYGWGATATGGTFSVNAWSMTGEVSAVPEPSTYAAIAGGLVLAGAVWQRRRTRGAAH